MIESVHFPNVGFLKINLTDKQVEPIKNEILKLQQPTSSGVPANPFLVGNIEKEYGLYDCKNHLSDLLRNLIGEYEHNFNFMQSQNMLSTDRPLVLDQIWVNFQKKYEFNPMHNHAGVFSFVIWIKIPFLFDEEILHSPGYHSKIPMAGNFCFYYTNVLGEICHFNIPVDQTWENTMIVFPAKLNHAVYPFFNADGYRVSVSGNVLFSV